MDENRTVEMYRIKEDNTWDTVMVELPADTPKDCLEEVARSHAIAQYGEGAYISYKHGGCLPPFGCGN